MFNYFWIYFYLPLGTSSQQKSLVLTPEEFARLTNQGVLRFESARPEPVTAPPIIPNVSKTIPTSCISQRTPPVSTVPLYQQHKLNIDDSDVRVFLPYEPLHEKTNN